MSKTVECKMHCSVNEMLLGGIPLNSAVSSNNANKKKHGHLVYDFIKITGLPSMALWLRPKVIRVGENTKIDGGYMVFANHCSFIDPLLIHCVFFKRRVHSLVTKDFYATSFKRLICKHMLCIQVDKDNFSVDSFHDVVRLLKAGKVVSIFPEGQVNHNPENMLTFKSGVVLMAYTAGKPILPVYLLPPEKWYSRRVAVIGEPINVKELCGKRPSTADFDNISKYLHDTEEDLKRYYLENFGNAKKDIESNLENKKEEAVK